MTKDYKVDPRTIHIDQRKKDTRRDAWDRDYRPLDWKEFEEACKIEPKKDYTIWLFAIFFCFILIYPFNKIILKICKIFNISYSYLCGK